MSDLDFAQFHVELGKELGNAEQNARQLALMLLAEKAGIPVPMPVVLGTLPPGFANNFAATMAPVSQMPQPAYTSAQPQTDAIAVASQQVEDLLKNGFPEGRAYAFPVKSAEQRNGLVEPEGVADDDPAIAGFIQSALGWGEQIFFGAVITALVVLIASVLIDWASPGFISNLLKFKFGQNTTPVVQPSAGSDKNTPVPEPSILEPPPPPPDPVTLPEGTLNDALKKLDQEVVPSQ